MSASEPQDPPTDDEGDPLVCSAGEVYGGYQIVKHLAAGGTCQIYEARHAIMRRRVAIKVQKVHLRANTKRSHRIASEAMALAAIDHPNVVRIYHADVEERIGLYIVMELLEGRDLRKVIDDLARSGRRLALKVASAIVLEIADAIGAFHRIGIIHRDLKPDNIFLHERGPGDVVVKLLDLGIAKLPKGVSRTTDKHVTVGTLPYMAPEQLVEGTVSPQSDVYALALVYDEMLSGRHAFSPGPGILNPAMRDSVIRTRIMEGMYDPLDVRIQGFPKPIARFVSRCLSKDPDQRPASTQAFSNELRKLVRAVEEIRSDEHPIGKGPRHGMTPPQPNVEHPPSAAPPPAAPPVPNDARASQPQPPAQSAPARMHQQARVSTGPASGSRSEPVHSSIVAANDPRASQPQPPASQGSVASHPVVPQIAAPATPAPGAVVPSPAPPSTTNRPRVSTMPIVSKEVRASVRGGTMPVVNARTSRPQRRELPFFAVQLDTMLDCWSLVLTTAPGAWRYLRIPLRFKPEITVIGRGMVKIGGDGEIPLPGMKPLHVIEDFEGDIKLVPTETPVRDHDPKKPLRPYNTFSAGAYTFMLVPPTPDGTGIPPDYETGTIPKTNDLTTPALLVKAGHKTVVNRMFPIAGGLVRIGGLVDLEVPLFRMQVPLAVSLRWDPSVDAFRVKIESADARVRILGVGSEKGLLTPYSSIHIDGWELAFIPMQSRRRG